MNPQSTCPICGQPLPPSAPERLCPRCLLAGALQPTGAAVRTPPGLDAVRAAFPQLEVEELAGQGGMGAVFRARQPALERGVALKILAPELTGDPRFAERFRREAQALARLSHPHIVTIHDFGQAGGFYYLLMEFVDGVNLRQAMHAGRFTPEQALAVVPPVCEALQYAHEHGVVHRDIKPENLLLDREGRVKIADFGIARLLRANETPPGASIRGADAADGTRLAGTPPYMAPEQESSPGAVDHRADIYALGVVLYELLTGEPPGARLEPPSRKVQIDVRLDGIVLRALEQNPELRFASATEFKTQVETVVRVPAAPAEGAAPGSATPPRSPARFSRLAIAGAVWIGFSLVSGLAGLAVYFLYPEPLGTRWMIFLTWFRQPLLTITAPLGATILGWIAVRHIRRSAGMLRGLGLAVFDGILFPLVALDALIGWWIFLLFKNWVPQAHDTAGIAGLKGVLVGIIPALAALDWLVVCRVWRAVNPTHQTCFTAGERAAPKAAWLALASSGASALLGTTALAMRHGPTLDWLILAAALAGLALGLATRKSRPGKAAAILGGINVAIWLLVSGLHAAMDKPRSATPTHEEAGPPVPQTEQFETGGLRLADADTPALKRFLADLLRRREDDRQQNSGQPGPNAAYLDGWIKEVRAELARRAPKETRLTPVEDKT